MEHKHAEILRAIASNTRLEIEYLYGNSWLPMTYDRNPITHPDREWRIKPKPPIVVDECVMLNGAEEIDFYPDKNNIRFTFDSDTKLPIKVELI